MEKINIFSSPAEAIDLLDNGASFYHIFTRADDDTISRSEVEKLSGSGKEKQMAVLYLDLALSNLTPEERGVVEGRFDDYLRDALERYKPIHLMQNRRGLEGTEINSNVILEGTPIPLEGKGHTSGYVVIPVIDVFTLIPIDETYTVYGLADENTGFNYLIAHRKEMDRLPNERLRLAGQVNHFQLSRENDSVFERFIEIAYYALSSI